MREIPEKIDSKFRFVLLASQRAEQMMRGARAKIEAPVGKATKIAMEEILTEAVEWEYGPPEPEIDPEAPLDEAFEELAVEDVVAE